MKKLTWKEGFADGVMCAAQFIVVSHGEDSLAEQLLKTSITKKDAKAAMKRSGDFGEEEMKEIIENL